MTASMPPVAPQAKTSGLAIAALVCGIAGLCTAGLGGIAGLILGIVGIRKINRSAGQLKGKGLAIGGIIVGVFSVLLWGLVIAIGVIGFIGGVAGLTRLDHPGGHEVRERSFTESTARTPRPATGYDLTQVGKAFEAFSDALKRRDCARLAELSRGESVPATEEEWREMLASPTKLVPGTSMLANRLPEALSRSGGYSGSSMNDTAKYEAAGATFHFKRQDDGRWYFCGFE
jgi:hypothetical protein